MAVEVYIPKMSDHMESGRVLRWYFQEGDSVQRGEVLFEIETDKAIGEVQAEADGILRGIRAAEGDEVQVGEPVAWILAEGEALPAQSTPQPAAAPVVEPSVAPQPTPSAPKMNAESGAVRATPAARKLARELGVDLRQVSGSGPQGAIREEDVRKAANANADQKAGEGTVFEPFTTVQRLAGQRLTKSVHDAPHFFLRVKIDADSLLAQMKRARDRVHALTGEQISLTALLARGVAFALQKHPRMNAEVEADGLRLLPSVNLGIAADTPAGLVVPVIHGIDRLSLAEITLKLRELQRKARDGRLAPQDLEGGSFTLSNLGMFGIDEFQAIINPPQVAILAVGKLAEEPFRQEDGSVGWVSRFSVSLSADHRAVDGASAARFLTDLKRILEEPGGLIADIEEEGSLS